MTRTFRGPAGSALLLFIIGCGAGSVGDTGQPVVSFSASPGLIAPGQTSTLEWVVTGARTVTIDNGVGEVAASGTLAVSPDTTTVYTLTAAGGSGTTSASVTVSILQPPSVEFSASPATVYTGGTSTLTWSVSGATSVAIDQGIGVVDAQGQLAVTPAATTVYTLTATNDAGTTTAEATVTVSALPVITFTAAPATVASGASSTLSWTVVGSTSVSINRGIGAVPYTGTQTVTPTATTTYTLTAVNSSGTSTATVTVRVGNLPVVSFTATPTSVSPGGSSTLAWTVTGASSLSIDQGVGTVAASGQRSVTPSTTTTYTLTAVNSVGATTAQVTVTVAATPQVTFTASPANITPGGTSTLSWSVTGATSIAIDQGVGTVAATGTRDVTPATTTTYTLTATNDAGTTTVSATVSVGATGWLYTKAGGNKIYLQQAGVESVWVGRGVNLDDLLFCGYNYGLWMSNPTGGEALLTVAESLVTQWRPTFVRLSLSMDSYLPVMSWTSNPAQYHDPMLAVVQALGAHAGVYVLVTLRTDASMDCSIDEATCLPTAATDAVYEALVTDFKDAPYVLFGVANEPGGNAFTNATIRASMSHVVDVIRAKEDALGAPHHIVVVQGNGWTSSIGFYSTSPLTQDNLAYEYHSYPPSASGYTYSNIPVIIGEYGPTSETSTLSASFFTDLETKQLPSAAWDFDPYNDCAPDLLSVNHSSTTFVTTPWGAQVKAYLAAH